MKKYKLQLARNFLCVPAVLETICLAEGYNIKQSDIADFFGINLPLDCKKDYQDLQNIHIVDDSRYWGIVLSYDSINCFFQHFQIKLYEKYIPINTISEENFDDKLTQLMQTTPHIVCGFRYTALYNGNPGDYGHVSIICDIDRKGKITLLDPGPKDAGYKIVDADALHYAIKMHRDGLWCIKHLPEERETYEVV